MRACAVETHVEISQEPLYTEIYRLNAAAQNHSADFVRACAVETHVSMSQEPILYRHLQEKCRIPKPRRRLCASLRSRNARQDFTRATLYGNLQEKCCNPNSRCRLCASLRSRNACQNVTRATLYGNLQVKCRRPKPRRDFVGACAVETHVKISQEPLYAEIYT